MYIFIVVWSVHISSELKFDIKGVISATPLFFIYLFIFTSRDIKLL